MSIRGHKRQGHKVGKRWIGWHSTSAEQRQVLRSIERRERQEGARQARNDHEQAIRRDGQR